MVGAVGVGGFSGTATMRGRSPATEKSESSITHAGAGAATRNKSHNVSSADPLLVGIHGIQIYEVGGIDSRLTCFAGPSI